MAMLRFLVKKTKSFVEGIILMIVGLNDFK